MAGISRNFLESDNPEKRLDAFRKKLILLVTSYLKQVRPAYQSKVPMHNRNVSQAAKLAPAKHIAPLRAAL